MAALETYSWPGNVRELENVIEQALVFAEDQQILTLDHLPITFGQSNGTALPIPDADLPLPQALEQIERKLIYRALEQTNGNKSLTAKLLGINRTYLYSRLEKYQLETATADCQES
jgi:two-component system response regulator HydG